MERFTGMVARLSRIMDKMAGCCIVGVMVLVVSNVLLRKIFKLPILGTVEMVGFLTALGVSLALASCAFQNGHIALDLIINKISTKARTIIHIAIHLVSLCFWSIAAWYLALYARSLYQSGVVSSTAQLPVYPVVLLIGVGMAGLSLVMLVRLCECSRILFKDITLPKLACQAGLVEETRKALR